MCSSLLEYVAGHCMSSGASQGALGDGAGAEPASSLTVGDTGFNAAKESPEAKFMDHQNQVARARLRRGFLGVNGEHNQPLTPQTVLQG